MENQWQVKARQKVFLIFYTINVGTFNNPSLIKGSRRATRVCQTTICILTYAHLNI